MPDELQPAGTTTEPEVADGAPETSAPAKKAAKKTTAKKAAAKKAPAKKTTTRKSAAKKATAPAEQPAATDDPLLVDAGEAQAPAAEAEPPKAAAKKTARKAAVKKTTTRKSAAKKAAAPAEPTDPAQDVLIAAAEETEEAEAATSVAAAPMVLFQAPEPTKKAPARRARKTTKPPVEPVEAAQDETAAGETEAAVIEAAESGAAESAETKPKRGRGQQSKAKQPKAKADRPEQHQPDAEEATASDEDEAGTATAEESSGVTEESGDQSGEQESEGGGRRRRRRGGRRRRKSGDGDNAGQDNHDNHDEQGETGATQPKDSEGSDKEAEGESGEGTSRRRRRRRRSGDDSGDGSTDDSSSTVTRVRRQRSAEDEITAVSGSTRLEAKKQRRREGREAGRRRAPIVSEAEFLARREAVDRVMVIRQHEELTQIAVLEDKVLVEHYVARESQTSLIGNVYLGRVQNVLPSMEAAFIDIGKGRNAVLYAGEVNWSALGHRDGQPRKIESVLTSGQPVLVQVTKDPIGHKGARLTSQVSLAGRFLVYVPDGTTSGISRKLPDTERNRLKALLKEIVPDSAGVIVRTAAEGASEDELTRDVERLKARWEDIEKNAKSGSAPKLLYGEPDLTLKVVRDLFTEDFGKLVIQGDDAWDTVQGYVTHVAPDLEERLERYDGEGGKDVFAAYRIDEQIAKGLDRKVWLPSGGSLVIDRTEAMTVVDVNTGKFTGSGGNLEETVTKNNLEAAEEIVRQLRLRDIGGIIVVDFIDMVLESNRDLVLRRLVECLGRDRTRHQVAEVTSLGLVQMTRKRIGTGLLEAFSENCEHCHGRGVVVKDAPVEPKRGEDESRRSGGGGSSSGRRSRGGRGRGQEAENEQARSSDGHDHDHKAPSPKDVAAMAKEHAAERAAEEPVEASSDGQPRDGEPHDNQPHDGQSGDGQPRDGRSRGRQAPAASTPAPAQAAQAEEATPEALEPAQPAAEASPQPAAEPARPQVVTRTRTRRAASRPAGQPEHLPAPEPVVLEAPVATPVAAEPVEQAAPMEQAAPVERPKVVTRTRGRRATRPAGPPTSAASGSSGPGSVGSVGAPPEHGAVEPGTALSEPGAAGDGENADDAHLEAHVEHVPIKKKGSRKR